MLPNKPLSSFLSSGKNPASRGAKSVAPASLTGAIAIALAPFIMAGCMESASPVADQGSENELSTALSISGNIAPNGKAYGWTSMTSSTANTGKVAQPGLNDNNLTTNVDLLPAGDAVNAWEAAGVIWSTAQSINAVAFINGDVTSGGDGFLEKNCTLQFTTDGSNWTNSGWTVSPAYPYNTTATGKTYQFSGTAVTGKLGARIVGQVRTIDYSYHWIVKEVQVGTSSTSPTPTPTPTPTPSTKKKIVAYLPNWYGTYSSWSTKVNYADVTHINLCFGNPDANGVTTLDNTDASIASLVNAAHAKGVKVLVSIGGASGLGNASKWLGTSRSTYVANLSSFVTGHALDGVDVDLEGGDVNSNYGAFVSDLVNNLRPKGKLITAAVAPWFSDAISTTTLKSFDFLNVMAYDDCGDWTSACEQSTYASAQNNLDYYTGRGVAAGSLVLGVPFYGWCWGSGCPSSEMPYSQILSLYPNAYQTDWIQTSSVKISYNGRPTIQKKSTLARSYGGVMFWELPSDASGSNALLPLIATTLWAP